MIHRMLIPATAAALAACAGEPPADQKFGQLKVEQLNEVRFAVSVEAINVDGYELARCIAAAYTFAQRDDEGELLYPFYVRDGGKITDEFRRVDGARQQTTKGVQTYSWATAEEYVPYDHDGRDVMHVDQQLADCEKQGLPTSLGENS